MLSKNDIKNILKYYSIDLISLDNFIDTSKGNGDVRFNYLVNDRYFLKVTNNPRYDELFFENMTTLIKNYHSIGIYTPELIKNNLNGLFVRYEINGVVYICHLEEKSKYRNPQDDEELENNFRFNVLEHLGVLANRYSNKNLSSVRSMWSIVELSLHDSIVDEKQENFDLLCSELVKVGKEKLVEKLSNMNDLSRESIKIAMRTLPQTVFQGDLNCSNLLVDNEGEFKGIIDFNMYGTEINLNCFLNESMYYIERKDFDTLTGKEIFNKMQNEQNNLLSAITKNYILNNDEKKIFKDYNRVIYSSFYPNVCLFVNLIEEELYISKVEDFLLEVLRY